MSKKGSSLLEGKRVLAVDDEPDVLESLAELLPMCRVDKAGSFEKAERIEHASSGHLSSSLLDAFQSGASTFEVRLHCGRHDAVFVEGLVVPFVNSSSPLRIPSLSTFVIFIYPSSKPMLFVLSPRRGSPFKRLPRLPHTGASVSVSGFEYAKSGRTI